MITAPMTDKGLLAGSAGKCASRLCDVPLVWHDRNSYKHLLKKVKIQQIMDKEQ